MNEDDAVTFKVVSESDVQLSSADPAKFTGDVAQAEVLPAVRPEGLRGHRFSYRPGARSNWHVHTGEQALVVVHGRGLVQWDGLAEPQVLEPGDWVARAARDRPLARGNLRQRVRPPGGHCHRSHRMGRAGHRLDLAPTRSSVRMPRVRWEPSPTIWEMCRVVRSYSSSDPPTSQLVRPRQGQSLLFGFAGSAWTTGPARWRAGW